MEEQIRFCKNCGNKINPGDKFCLRCGQALQTGAPVVAAPEQRPGQRFEPVQGAVKKLRSEQIAEETVVPAYAKQASATDGTASINTGQVSAAYGTGAINPVQVSAAVGTVPTNAGQVADEGVRLLASDVPGEYMAADFGGIPKNLANKAADVVRDSLEAKIENDGMLPGENRIMRIFGGAIIGFVASFVIALIII